MSIEISEADPPRIEELIACEESPVGIVAKTTHVLIIQKLLQIEQRLDRIERLVSERQEE